MAFALIIAGVLLFMAAYQNNVAALGSQISSDLTGSKGFIVWFVALFIVGAIGYIPKMQVFSRVFLALILIVIFLSNQGFFKQLSELVTSGGGEEEGIDLETLMNSPYSTKPPSEDEKTAQEAVSTLSKIGDIVNTQKPSEA